MVWSPFDRRPPARAVPGGFHAPPRLPAGVSYAFRSSPYQAYKRPYGLLTAHLWPDPPPPQGGLLDPFAGGDGLDAHAGRAPGAGIEPMPAHLRGIAPGPEGGLIGMMIQESWPEEADRIRVAQAGDSTADADAYRRTGEAFGPDQVDALLPEAGIPDYGPVSQSDLYAALGFDPSYSFWRSRAGMPLQASIH